MVEPTVAEMRGRGTASGPLTQSRSTLNKQSTMHQPSLSLREGLAAVSSDNPISSTPPRDLRRHTPYAYKR